MTICGAAADQSGNGCRFQFPRKLLKHTVCCTIPINAEHVELKEKNLASKKDWRTEDKMMSGWYWCHPEWTQTRGILHYHIIAKLPNVIDTAIVSKLIHLGKCTKRELLAGNIKEECIDKALYYVKLGVWADSYAQKFAESLASGSFFIRELHGDEKFDENLVNNAIELYFRIAVQLLIKQWPRKWLKSASTVDTLYEYNQLECWKEWKPWKITGQARASACESRWEKCGIQLEPVPQPNGWEEIPLVPFKKICTYLPHEEVFRTLPLICQHLNHTLKNNKALVKSLSMSTGNQNEMEIIKRVTNHQRHP